MRSLLRALFVFSVTVSLFVHVQIVSAVQYCHQKHIVHRDLKVNMFLVISHSSMVVVA